MPRRSLQSIALLLCCLAIACGGSGTAEPSAAAASGSESAALPPPPPPESGPETPAAVPDSVPNTPAAAQVVPVADPVAATPVVYKVVLDSPRMRILEGTWKPKQKGDAHGHPPLVAYALTDVDALSHGEHPEATKVQLKAGQAFFQNAVASHTFENVSKKPMRLLLVELKQGVPPDPAPADPATDALHASPDVYRKVFEDQHVRVLYATWAPGKMDEMHSHPGLAGYYLTDVSAKLHEQFGHTEDITKTAGSVLFHEHVKGHMFENTGEKQASMVLFEPKAAAFGGGSGPARAGGGGASSSGGFGSGTGDHASLPVEEGTDEVTSYVDIKTGVKMDIGGGFTAEVPPGIRFTTVVTFAKTNERPGNALVAEGFTRHAATLIFDGTEKGLKSPVVIGIGINRMPERPGEKFVLAMESSGECTKANKKFELPDGGCSVWSIHPVEFDTARGKVIAKLNETGGARLQFGWIPAK
jgi:hypothetical protein